MSGIRSKLVTAAAIGAAALGGTAIASAATSGSSTSDNDSALADGHGAAGRPGIRAPRPLAGRTHGQRQDRDAAHRRHRRQSQGGRACEGVRHGRASRDQRRQQRAV